MFKDNTFDILDEKCYNELQVTLLDTGGEEAPVLGIGEDQTGVYIVDLDPNNGINTRGKLYVTPGMRIMDVVNAGVKSEVFEAWASDDIRMKTCEDLQGEWDEFYNKILGPSQPPVDLSLLELDIESE